MKLKRIGHVAIAVSNIPAAIAFYQNVGLELVWEDKDWAYLKAGQDGLALLSPDYKSAGPHFGFVFDDRTELTIHHTRLKESGVFVGAIHDHRDGTASFYSKDADNNLFEFLYEPVTESPKTIAE
ncbi:MAG: VOC family protein [Pseudanabaenaceae cyanobacterium]|jgi:catechol 2,3-dioxygenase-like lactoylglutathione lyase family enzyme